MIGKNSFRKLAVLAMVVLFPTGAPDLGFAGNFLKNAKEAQQEQYQKNDQVYGARRRAAENKRDQRRSLRIVSGPDWAPNGRCKGWDKMGEHDLRYSDGSSGLLFLRCSNDCWEVSVGGPFGVVAPAINCGDFANPWMAGSKNSDFNLSLHGVGNFVLRYGS